MQLPHSKARQAYIEQIKVIEANLKDATIDDNDMVLLAQVQRRIDVLAQKYQYSEEIGTARYKLYELQALVHYFREEDDDALDFINQAIETRGDSYVRAEKLKKQLLSRTRESKETNPKKLTKQERRKRLIGLEGWLALFIVGLGLSVILGVINLLGYGSTFSDLASATAEATDYVNALMPALWFEVVANIAFVGLAIWLIVLLARHKSAAKPVAIIYLVYSAIFLVIDYVWASSIFEAFNVTQYVESDLRKAASDMARAIIAACIWVPYFLVSKRVKATLTE